ncbi:unnamed protein product [Citrullus colocynthis]|uniref:DUF7086 domain-containing protein n=1 Tax=Citrullus colocynthis TaxID=252529 RepID=A0ABP0ZBY0_9ROSI
MRKRHSYLYDLCPPNAQRDENGDGNDNDLDLSLYLSQPLPAPSSPSPSRSRSPTPNPTIDFFHLPTSPTENPNSSTPTPQSRSRSRSPSPTANPVAPTRFRRQLLRPGKTETIPAPYPWAKNRRAIIRSMRNLVGDGMLKIVGKMKCKKCEEESEIEYDLEEKFGEVEKFIVQNKSKMYNRAPEVWNAPKRLDCERCSGERCVGAVIGKKRDINWLFLFLGQMVGFCSLEQLKYFCKHTRNHQTGARNRLLYIAYFSLCNQLNPYGQYHL